MRKENDFGKKWTRESSKHAVECSTLNRQWIYHDELQSNSFHRLECCETTQQKSVSSFGRSISRLLGNRNARVVLRRLFRRPGYLVRWRSNRHLECDFEQQQISWFTFCFNHQRNSRSDPFPLILAEKPNALLNVPHPPNGRKDARPNHDKKIIEKNWNKSTEKLKWARTALIIKYGGKSWRPHAGQNTVNPIIVWNKRKNYRPDENRMGSKKKYF